MEKNWGRALANWGTALRNWEAVRLGVKKSQVRVRTFRTMAFTKTSDYYLDAHGVRAEVFKKWRRASSGFLENAFLRQNYFLFRDFRDSTG